MNMEATATLQPIWLTPWTTPCGLMTSMPEIFRTLAKSISPSQTQSAFGRTNGKAIAIFLRGTLLRGDLRNLTPSGNSGWKFITFTKNRRKTSIRLAWDRTSLNVRRALPTHTR
jgi:hypothetical protein